MNENSIKKIYANAQIPEIDLERKILHALNSNPKRKSNYTFKTVLSFSLIMVLTVVIAFAAVRIITNSDGSHTLINEEVGSEWTVHSHSIKWSEDEPAYKLIKAMSDLEYEGNQAIIGLYQASEDAEVEFWIKPANETYHINDGDVADVIVNENTPNYFNDLVEKLNDSFSLSKVVYAYYIKPELRDEIRLEAYKQSTVGEIYTNVITVEKTFGLIELGLNTKKPDIYRNTTIYISHESLSIMREDTETDFEIIEINQQEAILSKRSNGTYIVQTDINGYGVTVISNVNGESGNIVELTREILEVLSNYMLSN